MHTSSHVNLAKRSVYLWSRMSLSHATTLLVSLTGELCRLRLPLDTLCAVSRGELFDGVTHTELLTSEYLRHNQHASNIHNLKTFITSATYRSFTTIILDTMVIDCWNVLETTEILDAFVVHILYCSVDTCICSIQINMTCFLHNFISR